MSLSSLHVFQNFTSDFNIVLNYDINEQREAEKCDICVTLFCVCVCSLKLSGTVECQKSNACQNKRARIFCHKPYKIYNEIGSATMYNKLKYANNACRKNVAFQIVFFFQKKKKEITLHCFMRTRII